MTKRKIIVFSTVIGIVLTTLIITNYLIIKHFHLC